MPTPNRATSEPLSMLPQPRRSLRAEHILGRGHDPNRRVHTAQVDESRNGPTFDGQDELSPIIGELTLRHHESLQTCGVHELCLVQINDEIPIAARSHAIKCIGELWGGGQVDFSFD